MPEIDWVEFSMENTQQQQTQNLRICHNKE